MSGVHPLAALALDALAKDDAGAIVLPAGGRAALAEGLASTYGTPALVAAFHALAMVAASLHEESLSGPRDAILAILAEAEPELRALDLGDPPPERSDTLERARIPHEKLLGTRRAALPAARAPAGKSLYALRADAAKR